MGIYACIRTHNSKVLAVRGGPIEPRLCLKSQNNVLEEVSTVRGSGWVADQHAKMRLI